MEERMSKSATDFDVTDGCPPTVMDEGCPFREVLDRVGDKWSVLIVYHLKTETLRFNELHRRIGAISQRVLASTLRGLERDGLVSRTQYPTIPPRVDYAMTPLGRSFLAMIGGMFGWATENIGEIHENRAAHDARPAPITAANSR